MTLHLPRIVAYSTSAAGDPGMVVAGSRPGALGVLDFGLGVGTDQDFEVIRRTSRFLGERRFGLEHSGLGIEELPASRLPENLGVLIVTGAEDWSSARAIVAAPRPPCAVAQGHLARPAVAAAARVRRADRRGARGGGEGRARRSSCSRRSRAGRRAGLGAGRDRAAGRRRRAWRRGRPGWSSTAPCCCARESPLARAGASGSERWDGGGDDRVRAGPPGSPFRVFAPPGSPRPGPAPRGAAEGGPGVGARTPHGNWSAGGRARPGRSGRTRRWPPGWPTVRDRRRHRAGSRARDRRGLGRRAVGCGRWPRVRRWPRPHGTRYPIVQGPMTRVSDTAGVRRGGGRRRGACRSWRWPCCAGRRSAQLLAETQERLGGPAVGRGHPRLRAAGDAPRADRGHPRAPAAVRPDRRRPARPGPRAGGRRASRPICTSRRRACCGCSCGRRPALHLRGPRVRRPRRPAVAASCSGRRWSRSLLEHRAGATPAATICTSSSPAASTTRGRRRWSPPWPRRWPSAASRSACCSARRTCSPRGGRRRGDRAAASRRRPSRCRRHGAAGDRPRPRHPLHPDALRRRLRAREAPAAWREGRSADEVRGALGADEHRPAAGRVEGARRGAAAAGSPPGRRRPTTTSTRRGMYMIGQVAGLRDRVTTIAELHARRSATAAPRWLEPSSIAHGRSAEAEPAARPPATSPSSAWPASSRGPATCGTYWENILARRRRGHRGPGRPLGLAALLRPRPQGPRQDRLEVGRLPRRRPVRPAALRHAADEPAVDRAAAAAAAGGRSAQALDDAGYADRPFDRERTAVILGAAAARRRWRWPTRFRSYLPLLDTVPGVPAGARP